MSCKLTITNIYLNVFLSHITHINNMSCKLTITNIYLNVFILLNKYV